MGTGKRVAYSAQRWQCDQRISEFANTEHKNALCFFLMLIVSQCFFFGFYGMVRISVLTGEDSKESSSRDCGLLQRMTGLKIKRVKMTCCMMPPRYVAICDSILIICGKRAIPRPIINRPELTEKRILL